MLRMPYSTNVKALGAETALSASTNTAINLSTILGIPMTTFIRGNAFLLEDALKIASYPPKMNS